MTQNEQRAIHPKFFYTPISEGSNAAVEDPGGKISCNLNVGPHFHSSRTSLAIVDALRPGFFH